MSRYRIKHKGGRYYPQRRGRFFWRSLLVACPFGACINSASTRSDAALAIERDRLNRQPATFEYLPD